LRYEFGEPSLVLTPNDVRLMAILSNLFVLYYDPFKFLPPTPRLLSHTLDY
jgi:hypothetical protein